MQFSAPGHISRRCTIYKTASVGVRILAGTRKWRRLARLNRLNASKAGEEKLQSTLTALEAFLQLDSPAQDIGK